MWALILKLLSPKKIAGAEAGIICVVLVFAWNQHDRMKTQRAELETVRSSLEHPKVVEIVKTITVQGPIRIVRRIVERPSGEKETTIEETHEAVSATISSSSESSPVSLSSLASVPRTDRYLLTFGLNRLSKDLDGKALFVGYSIKNRVDIQAGVIKKDSTSPWLLATLRF